MIDFESALVTLADAQVRFVIADGLAVTIHGSAYVTFDLDFCYARQRELPVVPKTSRYCLNLKRCVKSQMSNER